jgi:hypothetical protein
MKTTRTSLPKAQKGCNFKKAQRVNNRRSAMKKVGEGAGKVIGGILGVGLAGAAGYGVKKLSEQKNGGLVKKQAGGGASIVAAMKKGGMAKKKK